MATYGSSNSFSLGYNLYADLLLGTGLVNSSVGSATHACRCDLNFRSFDADPEWPDDHLSIIVIFGRE